MGIGNKHAHYPWDQLFEAGGAAGPPGPRPAERVARQPGAQKRYSHMSVMIKVMTKNHKMYIPWDAHPLGL